MCVFITLYVYVHGCVLMYTCKYRCIYMYVCKLCVKKTLNKMLYECVMSYHALQRKKLVFY